MRQSGYTQMVAQGSKMLVPLLLAEEKELHWARSSHRKKQWEMPKKNQELGGQEIDKGQELRYQPRDFRNDTCVHSRGPGLEFSDEIQPFSR